MSDHLDKLFKAARQAPVDTARVEFGFETRLLARLRADRSAVTPWYSFAWKLSPVFAAIVLALGVWNFVVTQPSDLHAAIAGRSDEAVMMGYLVGD